MLAHSLNLSVLPGLFAVCRLESSASLPEWALSSSFFSVTGTEAELSIVCSQSNVPEGIQHEPGWRCLGINGKLPFALTGIVASLANPLAEAGIGIFVISTYDTDYILVKSADLEAAVTAWKSAGHDIESSELKSPGGLSAKHL